MTATIASRTHSLHRNLLTSLRISGMGILCLVSGNASAQVHPPPSDPGAAANAFTFRNPRDWAVDVAANEVTAILRRDTNLQYRVHVIDQHGDRTRNVIEAREGTVARTILRDGQPLTKAEDAAERERLSDMLSSPSVFARHIKNDAERKKLAVDLVKRMPDAMIYTYTPGQPQALTLQRTPADASSSAQVVLDYRPNPQWKPPTTTSEALTGLEGRMWIDPGSRQLLRMEGHIFQGVNLGWGMLAHIYPGGKLVLEQGDAGGGRWIYTHFTEEATVRALMLKTMSVHTDITSSAHHPLPAPVSYQDAIHRLLDAQTP